MQQNYEIDLSQYFTSENDPRIALVGQAVLRLEQLELENKTIDTTWFDEPLILNSFTNINNFVDDPDTFDCAMRSLGISAAVELFNSGVSAVAKATVRKKAIRKVITKIASRTLGVIGAAWAIYEFGECMEWW